MKRFCVVTLSLLLLQSAAIAQSTHDMMIGGGLDLIKTDNNKLFDKAQVGLEFNYFVVRHFSVGAGAELWTQSANSFVLGMRWYADDHLFLRLRALTGANEASLGAGWSQPLNANWRVEGIGDFYFKGDFALRAGIQYIIR